MKTQKNEALFLTTSIAIIIGGFALLVLFVLGSIYDFEIAKWFLPHHEHNFYGLYFQILGDGVYTIPIIFILAIIRNKWFLFASSSWNKPRELVYWTFWCLLFLFLDSVGMFSITDSFAWITWSIVIVTYIFIYCLTIWYYRQQKQLLKTMQGAYRWQTLMTILIFIAGNYLTVFILKVIFVRPRILDIMTNKYNYQGWWAISWSPYVFHNDSFPSGHVAMSMSILSLLFLFKPRRWSFFCWSVCLWLFIVAMGCSRVVYNRHFLTDILAAMIVGIAWYYFGKLINRQTWLNRYDQIMVGASIRSVNKILND